MSLSRASCANCPRPVEGRAITCSERCRKARSRRLAAAQAAEHLEHFEGLLHDGNVPDGVREAYAGLVERVPGLRATHARALTRGLDAGAKPAYGADGAIRAREWLGRYVATARPGSRVSTWTLFDLAAEDWRGSSLSAQDSIPADVFHEVARSLLDIEDGCYAVPAR